MGVTAVPSLPGGRPEQGARDRRLYGGDFGDAVIAVAWSPDFTSGYKDVRAWVALAAAYVDWDPATDGYRTMSSSCLLRRSRSAHLIRTPFVPGDPEADRLFILAQAREDDGAVRVDVPEWAPTIALSGAVRQEFGVEVLTTESFFAGRSAPGLFSVSAGLFLWVREPGEPVPRLLVLERDAGAPIYAGHVTEPAGRCGECPLATMNVEPNQELLLVACGRDPESGHPVQRPLLLGSDYAALLDGAAHEAKRRQVVARASALRAAGLDPDACRAAALLPSPVTPRAEDIAGHRSVQLMVAGRPFASFPAMVWVQEERRSIEIRRSAVLDLPAWVERLVAVDGEAFGRPVRKLRSFELGDAGPPLIPSLAAYRRQMTRPSLRVVAGAS